ncbi:MAG TPA: hypothetical protein PLA83_07405 [Deltaproteobacteria bacterium]|nr:hypothetical protein [Deltaproteobacteria bacterium]HQI00728.1 hypothetical protein [Deltaproteobacteria bacterium]HQJ07586.1 hypothetical protein [Deltaproteobacteria bacterium]
MKTRRSFTYIFLVLAVSLVCSYRDAGHAASSGHVQKDININKEDKEVGLRRMEIIDKVLSQDMVNRKMSIVHAIEADYNRKAKDIIDSIIPPVFDSKVFTHIEVNFFSPEFEAQVNASQKIRLSFILRQDGFDRWAKSHPSPQEAMSSIKKLLSGTLRIPEANISGLVVN